MKNIFFLLSVFFVFSNCKTPAQHSDWCLSECNAAGDEKKNTETIEKNKKPLGNDILVFPLRVGIVVNPAAPIYIDRQLIKKTVAILNEGFADAFITFDLIKIDTLFSTAKISELQSNGYMPYRQFSQEHDLPNTISLYLFDYEKDLCKKEGNSISCSRSGGFSYVMSRLTNNIVLSKFELGDHKVIVHEFGHFFGLYHTFEDYQFGKEKADGSNCATAGDRMCDTPADPGNVYSVYVNYSDCEMVGNIDPETGAEYHPMLNNYMAYYKPCYLKKYEFTEEQKTFIYNSSRSEIRRGFARK
ncbi:MAG TPA: hypothetical protein ENJ95_15025 [Bacteroidetes bacterium]|nr:hypothetical protein [Bacteroidota bacterium]